jgi:hypothetical protein
LIGIIVIITGGTQWDKNTGFMAPGE